MTDLAEAVPLSFVCQVLADKGTPSWGSPWQIAESCWEYQCSSHSVQCPSCDHSSCSTVLVMATKRPKFVECHSLWNKFQRLFLWLKYTTYQCNSDVACKSHLFHHQWVHHPNISYQFCQWYQNWCNEHSQLTRGQGMPIQWPGVPLQDDQQSHPAKEQHVLLGMTKS